MENNTNLELLLKDKIKNFGEFLISICQDETKIKDINNSIIDLPLYKILLFISFLDLNKIDNQINDFILLFKLENNQENRNKILENIQFFISVKDILNGN